MSRFLLQCFQLIHSVLTAHLLFLLLLSIRSLFDWQLSSAAIARDVTGEVIYYAVRAFQGCLAEDLLISEGYHLER